MGISNAIFDSIINHNKKKLALLIIANVFQWKCQCDLKACSYFSGSDVLFMLVEEHLIKYLWLKSATVAGAADTAADVVVFMTPLEHIRLNFNVLCGQIGSLYLHVLGKLWTYNMYWHPTFTTQMQACNEKTGTFLQWCSLCHTSRAEVSLSGTLYRFQCLAVMEPYDKPNQRKATYSAAHWLFTNADTNSTRKQNAKKKWCSAAGSKPEWSGRTSCLCLSAACCGSEVEDEKGKAGMWGRG